MLKRKGRGKKCEKRNDRWMERGRKSGMVDGGNKGEINRCRKEMKIEMEMERWRESIM